MARPSRKTGRNGTRVMASDFTRVGRAQGCGWLGLWAWLLGGEGVAHREAGKWAGPSTWEALPQGIGRDLGFRVAVSLLGAWHLARVGWGLCFQKKSGLWAEASGIQIWSWVGFEAGGGTPGPLRLQRKDSHLLLVGPLLAGPQALAPLLLDSHHEAPMLARSLAARRPGTRGHQDYPHPGAFSTRHAHPELFETTEPAQLVKRGMSPGRGRARGSRLLK